MSRRVDAPHADGRRPRRRRVVWLAAFGSLTALAAWLMPNIPLPRQFERWPPPDSGWEAWQPLYEGVDYARLNQATPHLLKAHALRVNLRAPGIEVLVSPASPPGGVTTKSTFATEFLKRHQLQVAVSAGAFRPSVKWPGMPVSPIGLMVSDGVRWSPPVGNLHALVITRDHRARFTRDQSDTADAWQAAGGNWITLQGGTNVAEPLEIQPRSMAGHSADGHTLYWLSVDGLQPGWSDGVTPGEAAELLRSLGATDALRFDDGSVVTMAKAGGWAGATVLNRPSHPYITGVQRPIGCFVGIRARPLSTDPLPSRDHP